MLKNLAHLKERFEAIQQALTNPDSIADLKAHTMLSKEYKKLAKIITSYEHYLKVLANMQSTKEILHTEKDTELIALAKEELAALSTERDILEQELQKQLLPEDPNDHKNCILELRAAAGGDEAAIWAGDLYRMYARLGERKGWDFETISYKPGPAGGCKEATCIVSGQQVYATLKYESGVHRVQRIPTTETQGRRHTSVASVVVLPEMSEVEVVIDKKDIRKEIYCSSGPGGQSVNTTYSAVRLTHLPTGIMASCQDEKSQLKNLDKALKILRARVHEQMQKQQHEKVGAVRKSMVGSGDRSDKIRTYNYPQARITDHRLKESDQKLKYNFQEVLDGHLDPFTQALRMADQGLQAN